MSAACSVRLTATFVCAAPRCDVRATVSYATGPGSVHPYITPPLSWHVVDGECYCPDHMVTVGPRPPGQVTVGGTPPGADPASTGAGELSPGVRL